MPLDFYIDGNIVATLSDNGDFSATSLSLDDWTFPNNIITANNIDGSGGSSGQVLQTDGTAGGVTWATVTGGDTGDADTLDGLDSSEFIQANGSINLSYGDSGTMNFSGSRFSATGDQFYVEESRSKYNSTTGIHDIREYGADPSGGTTSDTALDNAISAASPNDTILFKNGTYQLTGNRVISKPLTIKGENAEITRPTTNTLPVIRFSGGGLTGTSSGLSGAVNKGDNVIPVNDASLFSVDDDVMITDGTLARDTEAPFDFASVVNVDTTNNELTIDTPPTYNYTSASNGNGKVGIVEFMEGPEIVDLRCNGNSDTASWFLMEWAKDPLYENVHIKHHLEEGMYTFASWRPTWRDCSARWANDRGSGNGEPFKASKCQGAKFISPYVSECRRGVDIVRFSHENYVENPVIKKFSIGGVITHGTRCENTTIVGGNLVGDPSVDTGTAIYNSGGKWVIEGTSILASAEGISPNGNMTVSNATISPIASGARYAISIVDSSNNNIQASVNDPNGWFDSSANGSVIQVYAYSEDVYNNTLDLDAHIEQQDGIRILNSSGYTINDLTIKGRMDKNGTGGYGVQLDGNITNFDASMDLLNFTGRGYNFWSGSTIEGFRLHDVKVNSSGSAAVYINDQYTTIDRIWIKDSDLSGSDSIRILLSSATNVNVWNNRLDGPTEIPSADSNTFEQGDGSGLDSDSVDGYDVYVQSSAPSTSDPYIRFEP